MGANMVRRLMRGDTNGAVWDVSADNVKKLADEGAIGAASLDDLIAKLNPPAQFGSWCPRRCHRKDGQ
jgi:6-phosphogluconate dehydrogenase